MNYQTIFVIASMLMFFLVLTRESIIDFKIEYVPNNIIMESYFVSISFLIIFCILQNVNKEILNISNPWLPLINGFITFGFVFLATLLIAAIAYIKAKIIVKRKNKKNLNNKGIQNAEIILDLDNQNKKDIKENKHKDVLRDKLKPYTYYLLALYLLVISFMIGILQNTYPWYFTAGILVFIFMSALITYVKTKNLEYSVNVFACGLIFIFCLKRYFVDNPNDTISIWSLVIAVAIAFLGEFLIYKLFARFYENGGQAIDENGFLLPEDQQPVIENETETDKEVTFAIGGGDMILFGAIGLLTGLEGLLTIFVNSAFVFFVMLFGFMIVKRENIKLLPFVPAISIGYIMYFCSFNIINLGDLISTYMNM